MTSTTFGVRRQSEAATALWFRIISDPKRCRATLATALQRKEQP
jgi:hypothetical protein